MIDASRMSVLETRAHRPWLAALLSFLFPGLGQAYAGERGLAVLFAVPVLLLVLVVVFVITGVGGNRGNSLLSSQFLMGVLVVDAALLLWRGAAIAHAGLAGGTPRDARRRRVTLGLVAALLLVTVGMHVWVGVAVAQLDGTLTQVFGGRNQQPGIAPPGNDGDPGVEDPDEPISEPEYRWDGEDRINVLLLGTDAAPGRATVLTDVILVISVDPVANTAVMISVPRDTGFVPLPDTSVYADGLFPQKVNELSTQASLNPGVWCPDIADDPQACGIRTIERSVGLYLGLELHHFALIDMAGFAEMIDALGGLELCLPGRLVDPIFDGSLSMSGRGGLVLPAGCHQYNGLDALAYARSRQGWIEMPDGSIEYQNDFARAERQQLVLLELRDEMAEADTLFELPNLLGAIGRTVSTDFPRDQAGDLASLLPLIAGPDIERVVLGFPEFVDLPLQPDVNYLLLPKRDAVRDEMADIFGRSELQGWYLDSTAPGPTGAPQTGAGSP